HDELRAGLPLEAACFAGDDEPTTRHFGAFPRAGGEPVGCVSCMRRPRDGVDAWQVRGMATRADLVRHGIGRALPAVALEAVRAEPGPGVLWCNARVSALGFRERTGWTVTSAVFEIPGVGPHVVLERAL